MKTALIIVITVLITGGLVGAGTYYLVNAQANKDKDNLQKQITDLNTKISKAESDLAAVQTTSSTPNGQTANWKTYSNTTYKLSFKYPQDWKVETGQPYSSSEVVDKIDFSANALDDSHSYFYIESKAYSASSADYLAELKRVDSANQSQNGPTHNFGAGETTTVNNIQWLKQTDITSMAAVQDWYITKHNGNIVVIKVLKQPGEGPVTDMSTQTEKAQQILSSFQFTD